MVWSCGGVGGGGGVWEGVGVGGNEEPLRGALYCRCPTQALSLPAALMGVETEAQATRGFVHVRLAHGCSLGCSGAPGAAFGWVSGVGGWLAEMQWHHATTSLPPSFPFQPPLWCCNRHAQSHGESRDVPGAAVQHGEPPNKQSRHGDKWGRHGDGMGTEKERGSTMACSRPAWEQLALIGVRGNGHGHMAHAVYSIWLGPVDPKLQPTTAQKPQHSASQQHTGCGVSG
mgnify:CR=1 FL=1